MDTAIVLAAGLGKGAWPYAGLRQKVTLPVAQTPLVRRLTLQLKEAGIEEVILVVGHGAGAVRVCTADIPGVRHVEQTQPLGCGDAALVGLAGTDSGRVLVCCGDVATTSAAIRALLEADRDGGTVATVLGASPVRGLASWDSLEMDAAGRVLGIWNKGSHDQPRFGGMAAVDAVALRRVLDANPGYVDNVGVGAMPPAGNSFVAALNRLCEAGHEVRAATTKEFVVDVNRPWDLVEANIRANRALFAAHAGVVLGEGARIDDGADIAAGATVILGKDAHIGKGVIVKGNVILGDGARAVHGAILGANTHIGAGSVVRDYAALLDNTTVGAENVIGHCAEFYGVSFERTLLWHYCSMSAVIGARVDIGAATCCGTWRFDDGVREQRIGSHLERPPYHGGMSFLGDGCRTGVNAVLNPGVRIGGNSCIGPGVILYDDVPDNQLVLAQQPHTVKPWGPDRYAW